MNIQDQFKVNVSLPIDSRIVASGSSARDAIVYKYEGLRVFDTSDKVTYTWDISSATWSTPDFFGKGESGYITKWSSVIGVTVSPIFITAGSSYKKGNVGIVSKSGTLTYEASDQTVKAGLGVTTAIGIGGDPIIGTTTKEAVELLMNDSETHGIIMIGEIGGNLEADAARWVKADGNRKPVVGFIAGETAPKGRTMGHAGAIVGGDDDTAEAKKKIMRECGIIVVDSPADIGKAMAKALAEDSRKASPHHHANRVD